MGYFDSNSNDANDNSIVVIADKTTPSNIAAVTPTGSVHTNLYDSSGNEIKSLLDVAGNRNLLVSATHNIFVSANNSSTTNLASGATFTGIAENNLNATAIQVCIKADQPVTVIVDQSNDGTNWDFDTPYTLDANQDDSRFTVASGSYCRVRITNNGLATTTYFNLQTILVPISSVLPQSLTDHGNLKTAILELGNGVEDKILNADRAIFGQGVTSSKLSLLNADFRLALASNDITTSSSGGGSVTQGSGRASVASGTATTATAKIVSNRTLRYAIQREAHIAFDAAFTTPTNTNSFQRFGIYDASNGYFIGYSGTTFGITHRVNGSDTFTSLSNFNRDKLNGTSGSNFKRNGVPEAVNFSNFNVYRIRFGAASIVNFEIFSPDGQWVVFHRFQFANSGNTPALYSTALPYTIEVSKTGSDATNLQILSTAVDVSIVDSPIIYGPEDVRGRKYITANIAQQTASTTVYTVSTGRILKVTTLDISVSNALLSGNGQLDIRDGTTGTVLYTMTIPSSTNQSSAGSNKTLTFPVPLRFSSSVYAQEVSGTLTFSVMFVGYESEP